VKNKITLAIAVGALVVMSGGIAAAQSAGNSGAAKNMANTISGAPGKDGNIGKAAPTVSGKAFRSDSGWGNNGSKLVAGEKVSRGSKKGVGNEASNQE
jgi:hypothetical protein